MKKLFVIFASIALVAAFAVSASAADWSLYGNARMATYMVGTDTGAVGGDDDDFVWDLQGNSRLGANVKNENIKARVELALKADPDTGSDEEVGTRRIYAIWDMGGTKLKVGKDYTPINQFLSGQVYGGDAGLLGNGFMYGSRVGQLALNFGQFEVALITPRGGAITTALPTDVDETLPKIEAAFNMKSDAFSVHAFVGYQSYNLEGGAGVSDVGVDSTLFGADVSMNFGAAYVKVGVSMCTNGGNAGWAGGGSATENAAGDDVDDADSMQYGVVGGFKASDTMTLELGYGFKEVESDAPGAIADEETAIYVQAVIQLAPGVFVIPEFGTYSDQGADNKGDTTYFGAKWQINF